MSDTTPPAGEPNEPDPTLIAALEEARAHPKPASRLTPVTLALGGAVIAAVAFVGGYLVHGDGGEDPRTVAGPGGRVITGDGPRGGPGQIENLTVGTVQSVDGDVVTLKTQDGSTVKVKVSDDTRINVTKDGTIDDFAKGDQLIVNGDKDDDTVDAENITEGGGFGPMRTRKDG